MDKYTIAPPAGSTNNSVGAADRPWREGHFDAVKLGGGDLGEYLAESTGYGIVSGCEPTISGLTVTVGTGVVHLADGTRKEIASTNITLDSADSTNPRIDLVYIDSTGTVVKVTGTAAATPSAPSVPSGGISVCTVSVAAGATGGTITNKIIYNVKQNIIFASQYAGDNDAEILQNAINDAEKNKYRTIIIDRKFDITGHTLYVVLRENETLRNYLRLVGIGAGEIYKGDSGYMFAHNPSSPESLSHGLTFENLTISGAYHTFSYDTETTYDNNCDVIDCSGLIRCTFINCFFHFVRDVLHGESATLQSDYLVDCTLYCCRSYVHSINPCIVTDFMMNNCIAERSVFAAWFEGGVQDARFIGNCIEGLIYGIVFFKELQTTNTGYITNITLLGTAFEQNKKGHIIYNAIGSYGIQMINNGFYMNTATGYPMITLSAFGYNYRQITFYKNHFAGLSEDSIGVHIDESSGIRYTNWIEFYEHELNENYFTDNQSAFLDCYSLLGNANFSYITQRPGSVFTINANQTVVWSNATVGTIALNFPFVTRNSNYTMTITALAIEGMGTISPTLVTTDYKRKSGVILRIQQGGTAGTTLTTYNFAAKITFAAD